MNVIELLKKDHETVSKLFKSFEAAKEDEDAGSRQQIARQICQELAAHATVEEELFYPAVDAKATAEDEKAEDLVKEADEEHRVVKALVAEVESMDESEDHFNAKMKVLKDVVEHHVEEEEGDLMPKAKKLLTSDELEEIGARVEDRKEELKAEAAEPRPAAKGRASQKARTSNRKPSARRAPSLPRRARTSTARPSSSASRTKR
jgi:hemerythrin superfamily protein